MAYDHTKGKEGTGGGFAKEDDQVTAVISHLLQGSIKDFVQPEILAKWDKKTDPDQPAIEILMQGEYKDAEGKTHPVELKKMFTYTNDEEGNVVFGKKSNLGKFKEKYNALPHQGMHVKLQANKDGYFQLLPFL